MKIYIFILPFLLSCALFAQENTDENRPVEYPAFYQAELNTTYCQVDDWSGKLDLYRPKNSGEPTPLIIDIHGGGWIHGVKESHRDFDVFFKMNWAVANVEYRLAEDAPAPAAIEDVRCALIYLIENAGKLNINPKKIVVMGNSSGGHLALMTGLLGNNHAFDKNCAGIDSISVFAIIDKYGHADLRRPEKLGTKSVLKWVKGKAMNPSFMSSISPITYVNKNNPPVFIVHGDADQFVPYAQSEALAEELEKNGVHHQFITIKGGAHGNFNPEELNQINEKIIAFLKELGI